jgi:hypothetical protein
MPRRARDQKRQAGHRRLPRLSALLGLCTLSGCALSGCAKAGDAYDVTIALQSNTCGSNALPLQDGLTYAVQFEPEAPRATWKVLPKGSPIQGSYNEDDGKFRFMVAQTLDLDGMDAGIGQLRCTVIRTETLTGTFTPERADAGVDAGEDTPLALEGEHVIGFTADSNGSCRGASGPLGPFDRLPCEAKYELAGEPKD